MKNILKKKTMADKIISVNGDSYLNRKKKLKKRKSDTNLTNSNQNETSKVAHKSKIDFHEMGIDDRILEVSF